MLRNKPSYLSVSLSTLCFIILSIASHVATSQKIKLISGSLDGLKSVQSYDIQFTYDSMIVGIIDENDYLSKKKELWEEREPGKGDAFVKQWFDHREELYKPTFIRNFESYNHKVKLGDPKSKYTIIVKTKRTEGGYDFVMKARPPAIDGELWIVDSINYDKVIAKISFSNFRGDVMTLPDFDITNRIRSAYVIAGKGLGHFLKKKAN